MPSASTLVFTLASAFSAARRPGPMLSPRSGGIGATVLCLLGLAASPPAPAQADWQAVAVPYYTPQAFAAGQLAHWYAPQARDFEQAAAVLARAVRAHCAGDPPLAARQGWQQALRAWARLSTVAAGALIKRRAVQRVDYAPVRPEQINRTIRRTLGHQSAGPIDMEQVANAAKGLGALEYLLWTPASPALPHCPYAEWVADDISAEAAALARAFAHAGELDEPQAVAMMNEAVNQWLGAVEKLRMQGIERPLREAQDRRLTRPVFARQASGASAAERAARWQALAALAVQGSTGAPAPGGGLVPMETYLRGKGLNALANRLVRAVRAASQALQGADSPARLQAAARRLAMLKSLVEAEVAPALDIRVGFTDADGD